MCESLPVRFKKKYSLAEIYRRYFDDYVNSPTRQLKLSDKVFKAVNKTLACRTIKLGTVTYACDLCGLSRTITRACKSRFCSSCGNRDTQLWGQELLGKLLNVKHFHITTTLPKHLRYLSKLNGNKLHNILFRVSGQLVRDCFKKKFKVLPGIVSVLHTSGSDLKYHPHIHMIVSGGGKVFGAEEERYEEIGPDFIAAQQVLGKRLKKGFEKALVREYNLGNLLVPKSILDIGSLKKKLHEGGEKHWIVNIEKPLTDLHQIVGYVGRYTKRACLSEYKLEEIEGEIKFRFNDYKNSKRGEKPVIGLKSYTPNNFLDALLAHVPDARYKMVRYYGLYNPLYLNKIPKSHRLAPGSIASEVEEAEGFEWGEFEKYRKAFIEAGHPDPLWCPLCNQNMIFIGIDYEDDS